MSLSVNPQDGWMVSTKVEWFVCMLRCMNRRGSDEIYNFFLAIWYKYIQKYHGGISPEEYATHMAYKAQKLGVKRVAELVRKMPRVNDYLGRLDKEYWDQCSRDQIVEAGIDWVDFWHEKDEWQDPEPDYEQKFIAKYKLRYTDGNWYYTKKRPHIH